MQWQGPRTRLAALALLFSAISGIALADDLADCNQQQDPDLRIRGCSTLLQRPQLSAQDRAIILQLRGNAFRIKREFERALADYNEAMASAADESIRVPIATGIMMVFTEAPAELRKTAAGRTAIELLEKNFQKTKTQKPAAR